MRSNGHGLPVVAIDIDGTLGDYHGHFLAFAEKWIGRAMPDPALINPGQPLHKHMGVDRITYRDCKLAYRQGGLKRWMPIYPEAAEITHAIRDAGAEVWICTTRPYLRLDNIDPDTREWLRRNDVHYDAVLFDTIDQSRKGTKYEELKRQAGKRVAAVVEDLPEYATLAAGLLKKAVIVLRDQPYNRHIDVEEQQWFRAADMRQVWMQAQIALHNWEARNGI